MTREWKQLNTLQEVAAAQAAGDEIEYRPSGENWWPWGGGGWRFDQQYRSRPKKQTKTIVLRGALMCSADNQYYVAWYEKGVCRFERFVKWLDTPERVIEVEL